MIIAGQGAVVAGGASGLGAATVRRLVAAGMRCVIMDRDLDAAVALASELGQGAVAVRGDICSEADVLRCLESLGSVPLRLVAITAFTGSRQPTVTADGRATPLEDFQRVLKVNLEGTYNVVRLAAARMTTNPLDAGGTRGAIVMTGSIAGLDGASPQVAYTASKAAIAGMTLSIARDLAPHGIRVMTIAPGTFETPPVARLPDHTRSLLATWTLAPKRLGIESEYAALVLHIAENDYLNAETIRLDAGARLTVL